ncbi:hypothetical protein [Herbaspirillum frisingense]|uniref:hypothetical protein n=1 Tax=Herbaspirillum frisingense TaxID=92645 RepID=UPI001FCABB95|nr:hypothetical protein [Herbaspirillum frisingense]
MELGEIGIASAMHRRDAMPRLGERGCQSLGDPARSHEADPRKHIRRLHGFSLINAASHRVSRQIEAQQVGKAMREALRISSTT